LKTFTEDITDIDVLGEISPGKCFVLWFQAESSAVSGDEVVSQVSCCIMGIMDALQPEFRNQAILKGTVDSFSPAPGLRRICEDEADPQLSHGPFKLGWFPVILRGVEAAMAGCGKLGSAIEVKLSRQAVSSEHVQAHTKAAVQVFFLLKPAAEGIPCRIISTQNEG
jgi:hypothetical protein